MLLFAAADPFRHHLNFSHPTPDAAPLSPVAGHPDATEALSQCYALGRGTARNARHAEALLRCRMHRRAHSCVGGPVLSAAAPLAVSQRHFKRIGADDMPQQGFPATLPHALCLRGIPVLQNPSHVWRCFLQAGRRNTAGVGAWSWAGDKSRHGRLWLRL